MSSEPLTPATADPATLAASAASAAEKGLLTAVLLIVLLGVGAMLFMV